MDHFDHTKRKIGMRQLVCALLAVTCYACSSDRPDFEKDEAFVQPGDGEESSGSGDAGGDGAGGTSSTGGTGGTFSGAAGESSGAAGAVGAADAAGMTDVPGSAEGDGAGATDDPANGSGSDETDGASSSAGDNLSIGEACGDADQCASGFCTDGVCCETSCDETCSRCDAPGMEGTCSAAESDAACGELTCPGETECKQFVLEDESNCSAAGECALDAPCTEVFVDEGTPCQSGAGMCSGDGQCVVPDKLLLGEECVGNDDCGSGYCVSAADGAMRCCDQACDALCEACSAAGQCDQAAPDDSRCEAITCSSDTMCTSYPEPLTDNRCAAIGRCYNEATYCQAEYEAQGTSCGAGLACDGAGECASVCSASELWCNGSCIDPDTNGSHCGGCGNSCGSGLLCSDGECVLDCNAGQIACGGSCINPQTNANYCGASGDCTGANDGEVCTSPFTCVSGSCQVVCSGGQINCDDTCIDPNTDDEFCGASSSCTGGNRGQNCNNMSGYSCEAGVCRLQCPGSQVGCGGACIDPSDDDDYCGASGYCEGNDSGDVCVGLEQCSGGSCKLPNGEDCTNNSDCISGTCKTWYADEDGDGFGAEGGETWSVCGNVIPASGWVDNDSDCCDVAEFNSIAWEVNPDYSGGPRTDAASGCPRPYDYDCDGAQTEFYDDVNCTEYTTPATCPYGHYISTVPVCGQSAGFSLCGWVSDTEGCQGVTGALITQACY